MVPKKIFDVKYTKTVSPWALKFGWRHKRLSAATRKNYEKHRGCSGRQA